MVDKCGQPHPFVKKTQGSGEPGLTQEAARVWPGPSEVRWAAWSLTLHVAGTPSPRALPLCSVVAGKTDT